METRNALAKPVEADHTQTRLEAVGQSVQSFYDEVPFPGNLDAYGPWQAQAPGLLRNLGLSPDLVRAGKLLDAGCGTGEYSRSFSSLGAKVTGIDLSEVALQRARSIDAELGLQDIEYRRRSLFELPDETYDFVISLGVLHHTGQPERAFYSVAERVRPGGFLIVGLYNPVSRAHILAVRRLIRLLSFGSTERGIKIAGSRVFRPLVRRSVGVENAVQPQRLADLLVHPHEKPVPIGDTLGWYRRAGFEIVGSDPSLSARDYPGLAWMSGRVPARIQNLAIELRWLSWNADYYVVAGRRAG